MGILEQGNRLTGGGLNNFHAWPFLGQRRCKPCLGLGIAVYEQDFRRLCALADPSDKFLAGGVGGEVEVANLAFYRKGAGRIAPLHVASPARCPEETGRG